MGRGASFLTGAEEIGCTTEGEFIDQIVALGGRLFEESLQLLLLQHCPRFEEQARGSSGPVSE